MLIIEVNRIRTMIAAISIIIIDSNNNFTNMKRIAIYVIVMT
jgi:hypothetical protein